jgi:methylenetetrahydrofolate reductase (NADPH)
VVWTQVVYDTDRLGEWVDLIRPRGILQRARVLVGLVPLRSIKNARFMDGLFGVHVPGAAFDLLEAAGEDAERVGLEFTLSVVERIRAIDGIAGLHLMGIGRDDLVRTVIEEAGLFPRPTAI